ncbi:hypothetical protein HKBW3S42_00839 [Candidatus Hakubella thermalkaliphila]|uniref:Uncharacterized protein n=1 Tax=Candidatus Hakubella thermalkaliphila TaxID=2754717 RepID=A0A6V8QCJ3_9ACTN|nr:hypothetical protein HKBW3S25_00327 [Candidatus Hakubella thermalkaliphila]GFP32535.1 hypothetical protein HKBW3S42_00839 [Candidatus Hakubella thermalkaliphila]GFP42150.1 hypothetical protein HKBW3C_01276 [Candidatus Hakubella thermalkaliphila]
MISPKNWLTPIAKYERVFYTELMAEENVILASLTFQRLGTQARFPSAMWRWIVYHLPDARSASAGLDTRLNEVANPSPRSISPVKTPVS